jgi:hypothetical protein
MLDFNSIEQQTHIKIYEPWKVLVTVVFIPINMLGLSTWMCLYWIISSSSLLSHGPLHHYTEHNTFRFFAHLLWLSLSTESGVQQKSFFFTLFLLLRLDIYIYIVSELLIFYNITMQLTQHTLLDITDVTAILGLKTAHGIMATYRENGVNHTR